jgi:hypothetical protein
MAYTVTLDLHSVIKEGKQDQFFPLFTMPLEDYAPGKPPDYTAEKR